MEYNQTLSQDLVTGNIMSRHRFSRARRTGFTIVELTIALVVIGVILSGILKGKELINGAKIRAIVDSQSSLSIAWLQFENQYGAKPGDYALASVRIPNATNPTTNPGNGVVERGESVLAMEHLALARMIKNCQQCIGDPPDEPRRSDTSLPTANNSLTNQYGGVISIWHNGPQDSNYPGSPYYAIRRPATSPIRPIPNRLQIHTGPRIPSNILAEVDRKIDDGLANSGNMVFNRYDPTDPIEPMGTTGMRPGLPACTNTPTGDLPGSEELRSVNIFHYRFANRGVEGNCGGGVFIRR